MREEIPYISNGPGKIWIGLEGGVDKEAKTSYKYEWFANGYDGPTYATPDDSKKGKRAWTDWHNGGNNTKGDCGILMAYGELNDDSNRANDSPTVPKI